MPNTREKINRISKFEDLPELLTVGEFKSYLGMGRTTVYQLIRTNQIEHHRFGRRIFIPKTVLNNHKDQEKNE